MLALATSHSSRIFGEMFPFIEHVFLGDLLSKSLQTKPQRMDTLGRPLPLMYGATKKRTPLDVFLENEGSGEKVEGREFGKLETDGLTTKIKSKPVKPRTKILIGDPLPLDYNSSEPNRNDVLELEKKKEEINEDIRKRIKLSDIGDPLPLKYESLETTSTTSNEFNPSLASMDDTGSSFEDMEMVSRPKRRLVKYNIGDPLPLLYNPKEEDNIETQEYFRWKDSATDKTFSEWKYGVSQREPPIEPVVIDNNESNNNNNNDDGGNNNNSTKSNDGNDDKGDVYDNNNGNEKGVDVCGSTSGNKEAKKEEKQDIVMEEEPGNVTSQIDKSIKGDEYDSNEADEKHDGVTSSEQGNLDEMITFNEITQLLANNSYDVLRSKSQDADFRIQLIRYLKQLEKQHDVLNGLLQGETQTVERRYWNGLLIGCFVLVILCTVSYFLAD